MSEKITGLDKITARILAEAESFAEAEIKKARAEADERLAAAEKKSAVQSAERLDRARAEAEALTASAVGSAERRERGALLALRVELADKAFDAALEKLSHLPEDAYVPAMAALLAETVNAGLDDGASAFLSLNDRDMAFAEKILEAAKSKYAKAVTVAKAEKSAPIRAGFLLICGDIEFNCSAEAILAAARDSLEKPVLDILFGA